MQKFDGKQIEIVEKPDWVSWDDIKQCLIDAHAENRSKGIHMTHYLWPVEKIQDYIEGNNGKMFVALDGDNVIGTAAYRIQNGAEWYRHGRYAYVCFGSVLPKYTGMGVLRAMNKERDKSIKDSGVSTLFFDTNLKNTRRMSIAFKEGYHLVDIEYYHDHYSVRLAKWLTDRHSVIYIYARFMMALAKAVVRRFLFVVYKKK